MTQQNVRQSQSFFNDFNVREATLRAGDGILVKIVFFTEKHKIADKWESEPYALLSQSIFR